MWKEILKWKVSRSLGISVRGDRREFKKKDNIQHKSKEKTKRRRKESQHSFENKEVKKLKLLFLLKEKQIKNILTKLKNKKGELPYNLLLGLELRLDSIVFRSGIASKMFVRQLINHGHIFVNEKKINKPSYRVKIGEIVTLSKDMINNEKIKYFLEKKVSVPNHIDFNREKIKITLIRNPLPDEEVILNSGINIPLIIERYNRKI